MVLPHYTFRGDGDASILSDDVDMTDNQALSPRKTDLLETFFKRYDWRLPLDLTPSDSAFRILARSHKRRIDEFVSISRVLWAAVPRDITVDHIRIKGANGDLLLDPSKSITKKNRISLGLANRSVVSLR